MMADEIETQNTFQTSVCMVLLLFVPSLYYSRSVAVQVCQPLPNLDRYCGQKRGTETGITTLK